MSCSTGGWPRAPIQIDQTATMAWRSARPSSGRGDGTALGAAITPARRPKEMAARDALDEHFPRSDHSVRWAMWAKLRPAGAQERNGSD